MSNIKYNLKMKKTVNKISILVFIFFFSFNAFSQGPPPPPGENGNGTPGNDVPGQNAPIGSGLLILLGLGAAYGGRKLYKMKAEELED
jgi:hypothetical protein